MRRRGIGGPRDTLITVLRWRMKAAGMNPYQYQGLSRRGTKPLKEGMDELTRREASGSSRPLCPKCGGPNATGHEEDVTPTGRQRLTCASCGHRFTKDPKFLSARPPSSRGS